MALETLPRVNEDARVIGAKAKHSELRNRRTAAQRDNEELGARISEMRRALLQLERKVLMGDVPEAQADGLRQQIEQLEARDLAGELRKIQGAEEAMAHRVVEVEDAVRSELAPLYNDVHREIAERQAAAFLEVAAVNEAHTAFLATFGSGLNLPVHPWRELAVSENPNHPDYYSQLSQWLRAAHNAGYLTTTAGRAQ